MKSVPATIFLGTLLSCLADARLVVHETAPNRLPSGWKYVGPAADSTQLSLSVALKQPGLQELRARLDRISNPSHQDYGAHLSRSELGWYRDIPDTTVQAVVSWLEDNDISDINIEDAWVRFNATVGQAEGLLNCTISKYQKDGVSSEVYRSKQYSLPEELLDSVDYVYPITQFLSSTKSRSTAAINSVERRSESRTHSSRAAMPESCLATDDIVPDCIVDLYNITYSPQDNLSNSSLGIAGFLEQYPSLSYIHDFLSEFSPRRATEGYTSDYNFTTVSVNGGSTESYGTGAEANLDVICSMPYIQPLDVQYFSTAGRGAYINDDGVLTTNESISINEPWVPFLEDMIAQETVPQVLSISYTDDEQSVPIAYATRVCDLFMQLTSRGVSVLVASGDGGAAGTGTSSLGCYANNGFSNETRFIPTFPADCPYVTSVGATAVYSTVAAADFSSGGFSNYFSRPAWQENATSGYITAMNGAHEGWYNASGRGIPDISAIGSHIAIGGGLHSLGTSASTPMVAAMIALINDKRLRAGKPVLGFLNPLLYSGQVDEAILDCTEGSGGSCTYGDKFELGFDALPGWDAVTGLGTINLGKMLEILS